MTDKGLSPADRQMRDVYGNYGRAMYMAQAVEATIKGSLVMARFEDYEVQDDFEAEWSSNFTSVMGRLIKKLTPFLGDDIDMESDLRLALKVRNQLAHHFFWDHTDEANTARGRRQMIAECQAATALFEELNERLYNVMRRFAQSNQVDAGPTRSRVANDLASESAVVKSCGRCSIQMELSGTERRPYFECPKCNAVALI